VFWATWIPLIAALWWQPTDRHRRWLVIAGVGACCVIIVTTASSTPVFAAGGVALGFIGYRFRHSMRAVRWATVALLVFIHFVKEKPAWHVIAQISAVGGSTGHHRYRMIDNFIHYFPDWALNGVRSTAYWGHFQYDVTNYFVAQGVGGGLITLVIFLAMIAYAFHLVGRGWRAMGDNKPRRLFVWALGTALFVHCMAFFGVSYFGQAQFNWGLQLGLIGGIVGLMAPARKTRTQPAPLTTTPAHAPTQET